MNLHRHLAPLSPLSRQLFIYLLMTLFFVLGHVSAHASAPNKKKCNLSEIALKNCQLRIKNVKLHFLEDKILIHDGVWRTIEKIPLIGKSTEWKDVQVSQLGTRLYIQIWIWTEPKGEAEVQNLKWYVLQVDSRSLNLVFDESVQKRNRNLNFDKGHYFYDKTFPHELKEEGGQPVIYFKNTKTAISKLKKPN